MDEDQLQHLRQIALQTLRSKQHAHVPAMPSTQSVSLAHQLPTVTVNPLLPGMPVTAPRLTTSLNLQGSMAMAGIPSMAMPSRAGINPAQLPPPPPPPGPPPPKQGSVPQGMTAMPYSVLGKLPSATVTPASFGQSLQTQAGFVQSSQTPSGFAQPSQTLSGFAQPSQAPAGFVQSSQTPSGFIQSSQTPAGFAQASHHSLYQMQGMPSASPVSIFSANQTKLQKAKAPSRTPEHTPEDRTSRRGDGRFYKRSRSHSSYSRSASRSRSPRRRSRSSTYSNSRSSSYSTSSSDYSTSSSSETDSSRSPSPVRTSRRKGRSSHHRKDKEKLSSRRKEKERKRRREKRKRKRRREYSPAERSEQSTPEPGYHSRPLYDSSAKDYSSPSKRLQSDLPRSSRDRRMDYGPPRALPPHASHLDKEYPPPLRLSDRLSPRPSHGRLSSPMGRMPPRMRRSDHPVQMRDQYPNERFDMDYSPPVDDYSPPHYSRQMSPLPGGNVRDQSSPRRLRLGDRTGRGRDGRGNLRRVGQDGRGHFRGMGSDGWDNDMVRSYEIRNEMRWPDIRSDGRRLDSRSERRRLDIRSEGRRPDIGHDRQTNIRVEGRRQDTRTDGRQPDIRSDSRRLDLRIEGRRSDTRREGRRPDMRSEQRQTEPSNEVRHLNARGESRRSDRRSEGRNLDIRSDMRRLETSEDGKLDGSESRRPVRRGRQVTDRQGEEGHSKRDGQGSRDGGRDERGAPLREVEQKKTTASIKDSVSEEEPEGHSGHSHGEESGTDDDTQRDSHSDAEPPDAGKEKKEGKEKEKEEEEEEEEGLVRSSEEEEEQGGGNTEDSLQEQSNMLGWGEDVIELAYDDEFGEEDLQAEEKQPSLLGATRTRSSSISGGREEAKDRPKGKKRISSPIRVSPTPEDPYLSRHTGRGDHKRHHWKQSILPASLANRLGPKDFRGSKSRDMNTGSKGSAEEIARRHRMMRGQHGGESGQGQRRRTDRKTR